jgi:putative two-component system response regulator
MSSPSNILIVDDDSRGRETLEAVLTGLGHNLHFCDNGLDALKQASILQPDLILLDVMMPGIDGFEVCRRIRADPLLADVPVVMTTALDDKASRLEGIEAGADDFISKPIDRMEIRARVNTIIRLNRYRKLMKQQADLLQAHHELQDAYEATLKGWVRALDFRDNETGDHSRRVTLLTVELARLMGINEDELVHVRRSALLHDIGKIAVPDSILHKTGPLTEAEWDIMRKHPQIAIEMLEPIEYLRPALAIPFNHHERWDGTGYPRGIKGEEIPLAARIFAVVDVWDALSSDRPYRKAWPYEKIVEHMRQQSGTHFDPKVVELFLQMMVGASHDTTTSGA